MHVPYILHLPLLQTFLSESHIVGSESHGIIERVGCPFFITCFFQSPKGVSSVLLLMGSQSQPWSWACALQPLGLQQRRASFRTSQFRSCLGEQTLLTATKLFGKLYKGPLHWLALHDALRCFKLLDKILGGLWVLGGIWVSGGLLGLHGTHAWVCSDEGLKKFEMKGLRGDRLPFQ